MSQSFLKLEFKNIDELALTYEKNHKNVKSLEAEVTSVLTSIKSKGYISVYVDTLVSDTAEVIYSVNKGDKYRWKKLSFSQLTSSILDEPISFDEIISPIEIEQNIKLILTSCENKGYPFACVFFDSIQVIDTQVEAKLHIKLNEFVVIDSVILKGKVKTSSSYIEKYIGISKGDVYSEKKIKGIRNKMNNIPFVEMIRSPEVYFTKGKASLVLYLNDKGANRFDGIIGLNPDETSGKLNIVGDLKIELLNAFKKGEKITLNWEQAKTNTQNYLADVSYPFLFNSRIGLRTKLNYFRQDTSFANLNAMGGFSFFVDDRQQVSISAQLIESNSLSTAEFSVSGIPNINSVSTLYYGLNYTFNSLDYRINPRKGIVFHVDFFSGNKTIEKEADLTGEYENINTKSNQIKTDLSISYFLPLFRKNTLLFQIQSGNIFGDNIFLNELYQIGGLKTIRGFNQQSLFASNYAILTSEFRYLFDRNSSLFGFFDYGYYENKSVTEFKTDTPFGFGFGVNFQSQAGIFTLSYGLGKQNGNPILVKNGKVHFGFISLF